MLIDAFVGGSYQALSPIVDNEETINLVIERLSPAAAAGRAAKAFFLRPGVTLWSTADTAGTSRAAFEEDGRAFRVIGNTLYEFDRNGVKTNRGTLAVDANPATISSNGKGGRQLFITSGGKGYIFNLDTNALTEEVPSGCTMGGFIDTFFVYFDATASTLAKSDAYDGTTWDPLEVTERGLAGDPWQAMCVSKSQRVIIMAGKWTTDVYYNNGDSPFPFRPRPDGLIPHGIAAPFSIKDLGDLVVWIAQTEKGRGYVIGLAGLDAREIGNPPLDTALQSVGDTIERFEADVLRYRGHTFYLVTIGTVTHVFDRSSGEWTKWLTWNSTDATWSGWRPIHHLFVFNQHQMGDRESSKVWELSQDYFTDPDDKPIRWLRRCPLPWANNARVVVPELELLHEPGLGVNAGQGADPVAMMRISFNGGQTWSVERRRALGKQGEYDVAARWFRCGSGPKPVVEFSGTDPAPVRIVGLNAPRMHTGARGRAT